MADVKGFNNLANSFFDEFVQDLRDEFASNNRVDNIIDFLETEVDIDGWLGPSGKLNERQITLLKAYDGIQLTESETALVQAWKALDRTTYDINLPPRRRQSFVLECGRSGSKCKSIGSMVTIGSGIKYSYEILNSLMGSDLFGYGQDPKESQRIAKKLGLVGQDLEYVETMALEGKNKLAKSGRYFVKGLSATKKVVTKAGYSIEGTPEHRVKVMTPSGVVDWKHLGDMQPGDLVAVHRNTNLFPNHYVNTTGWESTEHHSSTKPQKEFVPPKQLDEAWGYFVGLLVSNGLWTGPKHIMVSCRQEDLESVCNAFKACGLQPKAGKSNRRENGGYYAGYSSTKTREFLSYLGYSLDCQPRTKLTPWAIRHSPKSVQAAYLSGLFDGDGSVNKQGRQLNFTTASKRLAEETQLMLLNFGIVSSIYTYKVKELDYYSVNLLGRRSLELFTKDIGLKSGRKQSEIEHYLNKTQKLKPSKTDSLPNQSAWLLRLRNSLPPNIRGEFTKLAGNAIRQSSGEQLSGRRAKTFLPMVKEYSADKEAVEHFEHLLDLDYFYTPVVSVEDSEAFCVDFWVPGHEQYVAQGMTNHNTFLGAIIIGYEWYKLCTLPNPQQFFGVASSTLISIYCLAPAASQVKKTIFGQARAFLNYIPKVKRLIDNKQIVVGEEEIKYHEKLLYIYAGNSKGSSQVGSRVLLLVMDEVARFVNKDGNSNALELWSNVGVSGITFGEHARRVAISSAWEDGDAIQRLYTAARAEDSWVGFRFRTWDLNPTMDRNNPIVASEYALNPASARLEFEGDRSVSTYTYFSEREVLEATTGRVVLQLQPTKMLPDRMVRLQLTDIERDHSVRTYMHLDPAFTQDAYAMAFGHGERRDGQAEEVVVVIDGLAAWEPEGGSVVSILNVYDIITTIHAARTIHKLTTDHAQQHETIQRLRSYGINASSRFWSNRVQVEIYDFTRKLIHEGRLVLPRDSHWTALLKSEMMGIIYDKARGKISHPRDSGKDIIDCVCSVAWEIAGAPLVGRALPKMVGRSPIMQTKVRDWGNDSDRRNLVRQARKRGAGGGFTDDFGL